MAMPHYNPEKAEEERGSGKYGTAEIREIRKLVIIDKRCKREYIVDEFENLTGCDFDAKDLKNLWYSFDPDTGNFHIVPDEKVTFKNREGESVSVWLKGKLDLIKAELDKTIRRNETFHVGQGAANAPWTRNHKYIYLDIGETEYLLSFNRLWRDIKPDGDHICNHFGQAQFMRYPKADKHINLINDQFELVYPVSPKDNQYNRKDGHLVYNAPYSVKDDPEVIAKGFAEFIALCEIMGRKPDMPPRSIAIDKSIFNSDDGHHLLELDRETHQLVVYRRAGDKRLRDFYDLRKDFDDSPYGMFEREKVFPCIFGGGKSPTPRGFFRVESKTPEEYLSGYYPEHDQVKFFGYLEIVEDYFIHSDLYAADVTEAAMRSGEAEPLSKADTDTSGCVRVSQEALDWLVENIEVGAIVIL